MNKKVKALLKPHPPERMCQEIPTNISCNVSFIVDMSSCKSWDDWKSDDMGAWKNNGVKKTERFYQTGIIKQVLQGEVVDATMYTLVRVYYKNKTLPDLRKFVSYLESKHQLL